MGARKSLEDQFVQRLTQMAHVIERKQNELDSLAQRMQLPIDTDILKMRLQKTLNKSTDLNWESYGWVGTNNRQPFWDETPIWHDQNYLWVKSAWKW